MIDIILENEQDKIELTSEMKNAVTDVCRTVLDEEQCDFNAQISITITDNDTIREINREQRNIDSVTDVLSFPMIEYEVPGDFTFLEHEEDYCTQDYFNPDSGELMLGDIILSVEKVVKQASDYGHSPIRELAFLVAHSMMHLFGFDHMEPSEAVVMEQKQQEVLEQLGITR